MDHNTTELDTLIAEFEHIVDNPQKQGILPREQNEKILKTLKERRDQIHGTRHSLSDKPLKKPVTFRFARA